MFADADAIVGAVSESIVMVDDDRDVVADTTFGAATGSALASINGLSCDSDEDVAADVTFAATESGRESTSIKGLLLCGCIGMLMASL